MLKTEHWHRFHRAHHANSLDQVLQKLNRPYIFCLISVDEIQRLTLKGTSMAVCSQHLVARSLGGAQEQKRIFPVCPEACHKFVHA